MQAGRLEGYEAAMDEVAARRSPEDVFRVSGDDAAEYLERLLSTPVQDLDVGETRRSLLLTTEGRTRALLRLRRTEDGFYVASRRADLLRSEWSDNVFREDVEFHDVDEALVEIRGPEPGEHVPSHGVDIDTPLRGVDVLLPEEDADALLDDVPGLSEAAATALRVEAGVPDDPDLRDRVPLAAAADMVGFERCYPGQEVVARVAQRGGGPSESFVGFELSETVEPRESDAGSAELTTVAESPRFGRIALGYLDDGAHGTQVFGDAEAEVRELPFDEEVSG